MVEPDKINTDHKAFKVLTFIYTNVTLSQNMNYIQLYFFISFLFVVFLACVAYGFFLSMEERIHWIKRVQELNPYNKRKNSETYDEEEGFSGFNVIN